MQPQTKAINLILSTINNNLTLFKQLELVPLSDLGGLSMEISPGYNSTIFLDKKANRVIPLLFLCKDMNQATVYDTLCEIGNYLQGLKEYPQTVGVEWNKATVTTEPSYVTRQEDGYWIYSCVIDVEIYF